MELVSGQTLDERIHRQPMPVDEALAVARQIADALEAAHEKGIVHRDLKPANVKITPDGRVKVLDFGLAKLVAEDADTPESARSAAVSNSPTMSALATHAGVILGTAAYMAPEQARGRPVDQRADIFAFGCLLYKMLSGAAGVRRRERGRHPVACAAARSRLDADPVERAAVDPSAAAFVSRERSAQAQAVDRRCTTRPRTRAHRAGRRASRSPERPSTSSLVRVGRGRTRGDRSTGCSQAARYLREAPPPEMRLQIVTPPTLDPLDFALSPDGRYLVFVTTGSSSDEPQRLYLESLDQTDARPLAGTEGARSPFWSPDSRSLAFFASEQVLRITSPADPRSRWPRQPTRRVARGARTARSSLRRPPSARCSRFPHRAGS